MFGVLIVAYGNAMRSDDGLAWHAANQLEGKLCAEVEILRLHQLAPELSETISHYQAVIFVDAALPGSGRPGQIRRQEIHVSEPCCQAFSHQLSPAAILATARQLYAATTRGFSLTLTGGNFEYGEFLSPAVKARLPQFIKRIEELVGQLLSSVPPLARKP